MRHDVARARAISDLQQVTFSGRRQRQRPRKPGKQVTPSPPVFEYICTLAVICATATATTLRKSSFKDLRELLVLSYISNFVFREGFVLVRPFFSSKISHDNLPSTLISMMLNVKRSFATPTSSCGSTAAEKFVGVLSQLVFSQLVLACSVSCVLSQLRAQLVFSQLVLACSVSCVLSQFSVSQFLRAQLRAQLVFSQLVLACSVSCVVSQFLGRLFSFSNKKRDSIQ